MSARLESGVRSLHLVIDRPIERYVQDVVEYRNDLSAVMVWCSPTSGFTPGAGTLVFNGLSMDITITALQDGTPLADNTTYYVKYALISEIDDSYIQYSNELSELTASGITSVVANLTNDFISIPTDSAGANAVYTGANTTMEVFVGQTVDTGWTFYVSGLLGVKYRDNNDVADRTGTGGTNGLIDQFPLNIVELSQDSGYVDITAQKTGYSNITKRFSLSKNKAGVSGTTVTFYYIEASAPLIYKDAPTAGDTGTYTSITFNAKKVIGNAAPVEATDIFYTSTPSGGTEAATATAYTVPITVSPTTTSGISSHTFKIYSSANKTTLLDTEVVPVSFKGSTGVTGTRTAVLDVYQWASSAPGSFPVGNSTYTWSTATFTAPTSLNGWSLTPGSGTTGQSLYICRQVYADNSTSATSTVTWAQSSSRLAGTNGINGVNGTRIAFLEMYRWSASAPITFPSGTSTYTWATGAFTAPATLNSWSITPGASVAGQTLWGCQVAYSDTGTSATSTVTWNTSTTYPVGAAGTNGTNGIGGINVVLSNESHVFPASVTGTVTSYTGSGTLIRVYEGNTELNYVPNGTGSSEWYIQSAVGTNITNPSSFVDQGPYAQVNDHSSGVADGIDTSSILYTITGKTSAGTAFTLTKSQTFTKSKTGVRGPGWFNLSEAVDQVTLNGYTSATLTTKFTTIVSTGPVKDDVFTITGTTPAIKSWTYDGSAWTAASVRIDGNLVVDGTIRAKSITVDNLSSISANLGEVTAAKISTTGNTQSITLADTTNDTNIINVFSRDATAIGKPLTALLNYSLDTDCSLSINDYSINKIEDISPNDLYYDADFNFSAAINSVRGGIYANGKSGTKVPSIYARGSHNGAQLAVDAILSAPTVTNAAGTWLSTATAAPILPGTSYFVFTRDSATGINGFLKNLEKNYIGFTAASTATPALSGTVLHISPAVNITNTNYDITTTTIKFKTPIITKDYSGSKLVVKQNLVGFSAATISSITSVNNQINISNNDTFKTNGRIFEFYEAAGSIVTNAAQHPNSLTKYYVINQQSTYFQISLTAGGSALTLTDPGASPSGRVTEQVSITAITAEETSQYCTITNGSTTVGVTTTTGLVIGQYITSASGGIPSNTTITAIGTNSITISNAATVTKTVKLIFNYIITTSASLANSNYISVVPYAVVKVAVPLTDTTITDLSLTSRKSTTFRLQQHGLRVRGIDPQASGTSTLEKAYTYEWKSRLYGSFQSDTSTFYSSSVYLGSTNGNAITIEKGNIATLINASNTVTGTSIGSSTANFEEIYSRAYRNADSTRNLLIQNVTAGKNIVFDTPTTTGVIPFLDNQITLGSASFRWSTVYAGTGAINTSDIRQKTSIQPSDLGLTFINSLNPVRYKFKDINDTSIDPEGNIINVSQTFTRTHYGLIAQEVQQALPANIDFAGWTLADKNNPDSDQGLRYSEFIAPMIKAIQELSQQVAQLQTEIDILKSK